MVTLQAIKESFSGSLQISDQQRYTQAGEKQIQTGRPPLTHSSSILPVTFPRRRDAVLPILFAGFRSFCCSRAICPPPEDLKNTTGYMDIPVRHKEVPTDICEQDPTVKSYTRYVDMSENQHIFFWFFEARSMDPENAPLTVWINSGPGSSSIDRLFQGNGPRVVDIDGNVYSNPYS
jgi:hypothetical protein